MSSLFSNLAEKEMQEIDSKVRRLPLEFKKVKKSTLGARIALSWLRSTVASPKEFANKLGIGERQIYKWIHEEVPIPQERVDQVLWAALSFMMPLIQLRLETDRYLLMMRDPNIE